MKMQQTKHKAAQSQLGIIEPPLKSKRKDKLKHLCEEYNDGSSDIPNCLNAIDDFIRK